MTWSRWRRLSGFAADVELVGLIDQVSAALPVAHERSEQRRAKIANLVHVLARRGGYSGEQVIDELGDLGVFPGEAGYRLTEARRCHEYVHVEPIVTLGDINVLAKVSGKLDKRNMDALSPSHQITGRWPGQREFQCAYRLAQFGALPTKAFQEGLVWRRRTPSHRSLPRWMS